MSRQKILIVDDEAGMREMLNDLLVDMDCDLVFAKDGQEAFEIAQRETPDVILLDIMLPQMDGYQVLTELKARPTLAPIPVIMVTGHDIDSSARKGLELGAEDVLAKPFNMSELKLRVKTVLQLNRFKLLAGERSQFQWVVENADAGYMIIRIKDNVVTYLNPRARGFFNVSEYDYPDDVQKLEELIADQFEKVPEEAWANWPETEEKLFLVRPQSETSSALWLKLDRVPMANEEAEQFIVRMADVTEDMLMFQNMWQFEHLVSHKLRTPLMGLIGSLDALEGQMEDEEDQEKKSLLGEAIESSQRLHESIRGILEHLSSRKSSSSAGISTVGKLDKFANQLAMTFDMESVDVEIDPVLHMKELKLSDEELLLIMQELYENSRKFHPSNKPAILVTAEQGECECIVVKVTDNGNHLDVDALKKIGTPFYQAEKHFTGEVPGMGLGLSMISTMLTTRGGKCKVLNREDGTGLTVSLCIPVV